MSTLQKFNFQQREPQEKCKLSEEILVF